MADTDESGLIAYVATLSKPGRFTNTLLIKAADIDAAWTIARDAVAGTTWTITKVVVQPVWANNVTNLNDQ